MGSVTSEQGAETHPLIKSQPMALDVPVVATGARPGDQSQKRELFTEATETVLVFENGAVIRLSAAVTAGQLLFLTNKVSGKEIVTQVLRKRTFKPTACYVELEFTEAAPRFWGVEFPAADSAAKPDLPAGSVAAELAEAELSEEEAGAHAPPPDAAEVAKLRQEVEALKAQLKSLAPAQEEVKPGVNEKPQEVKPAAVKQEVKPELMSPNEPAPEVGKQEAAVQEAVKPAANQAEQSPSYPIRMQLPKSQGISNRTTEFAADDAAAEHLLPKPSLDSEQYPGSKEPSPKLYSRSARRGLAGPIGVLVLIVLLLVASGILIYWMGWFSKGSKDDASAAMFPVNAGNANGKAEPAPVSDSAKADEPPNENSATTSAGTTEDSSAQHTAESGHSDAAVRKHGDRTAVERKSAKRAPIARESTTDTAPANPADDTVISPKLVKSIRSLSPPEALRGYVSGNVKLDALVDETGHVKSATVISGPRALHDKAIETVKLYEYQPATKNGKTVSAHVQVTIKFWYEP